MSTATTAPVPQHVAARITEFAEFFRRQPELADAVTEVVEAALEISRQLTRDPAGIYFAQNRLNDSLDEFLAVARSEI